MKKDKKSNGINLIHDLVNGSTVKYVVLSVIFICGSLVLAYSAYTVTYAYRIDSPEGMHLLSFALRDRKTSSETVDAESTRIISAPIPGVDFHPPVWNGTDRVTILIMGLDYRDWVAEEKAARTDTMILLTVDPLTKTGGMLSIPRDMWVDIPGFKHQKINTAHFLGDAYKLPGGGPALAMKTVEQFLGIPINYYARVDFNAFVKFIDEIGGVKINVPETITIDPLGDNNTKILQPGVQVLPGELALAYARARHTEGGDFARAQRQQQVVIGIRNRILQFNLLPSLVMNAATLYQTLAAGIETNLALNDVVSLAGLALQINDESIKRGVIGQDYVTFGRSPDGLSILIPQFDKIRILRDEIFATAGSLGPQTPGNAQEKMQIETSKVILYNASSTPGLAEKTAEYLRGFGVNVLQSIEGGVVYSYTSITDFTGRPFTMSYLVDQLQISKYRIYLDYTPENMTDIEIYLGNDWAANNSLP